MQYTSVKTARFLRRPNRFLAVMELGGQEVLAHVPNTGRCRELLIPGTEAVVQHHDSPSRRTAYTLIAVWKETSRGRLLINLDSQAPNRVAQEAFSRGMPPPGQEQPARLIRREAVSEVSRFDFYLEGPGYRGYLEVKGVTLEEQGVVSFPDAPTERGVRHIRELTELIVPEGLLCRCSVCSPDGNSPPLPPKLAYAFRLWGCSPPGAGSGGGHERPVLPGDTGQPYSG